MLIRHVTDTLSSYLDNQLSEKAKLQVEEHLKRCPRCSRELAQLQAVSQKLKSWHAPSLGEEFDGSVRNTIVLKELEGGRVTMNKKPLAILIPSGIAAGILVLVLFAGGMHNLLYTAKGIAGRHKTAKIAQYNYEMDDKRRPDLPGDEEFYNGGAAGGLRIVREIGDKGDLNGNFLDGSERDRMTRGASLDAPASEVYRRAYNEPSQSSAGNESSVIVIQPVIPATAEGEMVIRTGQVRLEVESGQEAFRKASAICQELGGYISNSNFYQDREGRESGTITMRIPKQQFDAALDRLGRLGKLEGINTGSQDISQEYANLKAQLDAKLVVYNKMLEALQNRKVSIPEAIRLESELTPVARSIEDLKNRIEYLNNQVSFTTVTLSFHEPQVSTKTLKETKRIIKESLISTVMNAVKFLAAAIPVGLIIAFWLGIVLVAGAVLKYWIKKLSKRE